MVQALSLKKHWTHSGRRLELVFKMQKPYLSVLISFPEVHLYGTYSVLLVWAKWRKTYSTFSFKHLTRVEIWFVTVEGIAFTSLGTNTVCSFTNHLGWFRPQPQHICRWHKTGWSVGHARRLRCYPVRPVHAGETACQELYEVHQVPHRGRNNPLHQQRLGPTSWKAARQRRPLWTQGS